MKLVIDISEKLYEECKRMGDVRDILFESIRNGVVLPKGHGDLIDVGQCDRKLFYQQCGGADSLITVKSAFDMLMSLPKIIEADKESE